MTPYEERLCRTCKYGKKPEYYKPCGALYRDDCRLYEPIEEMTPKKAIIQLEHLKNNGFKTKEQFEALDLAIKALEQAELNPSYNGVKTELEPCEDCISREAIIRLVEQYPNIIGNRCSGLIADIKHLPSVTPKPCEEENPNCTECRYYDKEKHHCPRFCRVIENTVAEITSEQTGWIPVSERLPKENEYIGNVCKYYLIQDEYGDMHVAHLSNIGWIPMGSLKAIGDEIIAWQELPEPYKTESEDGE